jgi:hypothetical protein
MKLADLMYGHGSEFMCSLSGRFSPEKYPDAPPFNFVTIDPELLIRMLIDVNGDRDPGHALASSGSQFSRPDIGQGPFR